MNGGRNYNGPKVLGSTAALEKSDYVLEHPSIRCYRDCGDNASGADNQQERPIAETQSESSETIRRTSTCVWVKKWSELHGDMQGRKSADILSATWLSEIPCRVSHNLPRNGVIRSARTGSYR